jgi:drug/metabolite transporter (DMT)-like permease
MTMLNGILLALIAMLLWGFADLITKLCLNRESKWLVLFLSQLFGALILIPIAIVTGSFENIFTFAFIWLFIVGILNFIGGATFYVSMHEKGISLTVPIINAWSLVTITLGILFYGEMLTFVQMAGAALVISGIMVITFKKGMRLTFDRTFLFAIASMLIFGIFSFLIKIPVLIFGAMTAAISVKLLTALPVLPMKEVREKIFHIKHPLLFYLLALGLFEAFAFLSFNYAIIIAPVSLVSPIVTASPALSVLLGIVVMKEHVSNKQKIGILITLLGLIAIAL